ncbi:hypothetical protein BDD12DRAFT_904121 [Trichophaea hybrida]|nr:hypothetical protein BDD12DRAFT_904121 [Trichophaea hybrida]
MSNGHDVEDLKRWYWVNDDTWTHGESRSQYQICQRNPQHDFQGNWPGVSASVDAEETDESDLTELDIEEGAGLEKYKDVGEEEEEEDDVEEDGNEEEELVSSQDMECSSQFVEDVAPWSDRSTHGPGVATLGRRKSIVAAPRSFEQFLLEGSAYIVTKFQRDGKQGLFLNADLEHASKHLIDYPHQKVATKAIARALERLYNQDLSREKWAELLKAYRGWFGLVSYPDLPGNTPNNSQIVRLPTREDSLRRLASTIPGAFSPAHYTTSEFTETSTPEPEEEKQVTPEPPLVNTPEETFETPFTTPRLRAKRTAPDRRIFTSELQVEYNNDREARFEEISSAYEEEVEVWERECRAHKRQLLRYLDDNHVPIHEYDLHYQYHYGENYDGDEDLTDPELENETMAAQAAAAVQKEIMYFSMLHSMQYEGTTPVEGFLKKFELARNQLMAANPLTGVPNGPGGPVSGQNWPGPHSVEITPPLIPDLYLAPPAITGTPSAELLSTPISTGFSLVETMGDWANYGS